MTRYVSRCFPSRVTRRPVGLEPSNFKRPTFHPAALDTPSRHAQPPEPRRANAPSHATPARTDDRPLYLWLPVGSNGKPSRADFFFLSSSRVLTR